MLLGSAIVRWMCGQQRHPVLRSQVLTVHGHVMSREAGKSADVALWIGIWHTVLCGVSVIYGVPAVSSGL